MANSCINKSNPLRLCPVEANRKWSLSFSTPYFLENIKKLGYKTFSPFIDEKYDAYNKYMFNKNMKCLNNVPHVSNNKEKVGYLNSININKKSCVDLPYETDYEKKAIELATHASHLNSLKYQLADAKKTSPLFDGKLFARHLEEVYQQIHQRHFSR